MREAVSVSGRSLTLRLAELRRDHVVRVLADQEQGR
jgi:hypothetical protein